MSMQTITHMIDDVLSECLLHKQVQPGEIAFMEVSRRSGLPVCQGEGAPAHFVAVDYATLSPCRPSTALISATYQLP